MPSGEYTRIVLPHVGNDASPFQAVHRTEFGMCTDCLLASVAAKAAVHHRQAAVPEGQGDAVRVNSPRRDGLQHVNTTLRGGKVRPC